MTRWGTGYISTQGGLPKRNPPFWCLGLGALRDGCALAAVWRRPTGTRPRRVAGQGRPRGCFSGAISSTSWQRAAPRVRAAITDGAAVLLGIEGQDCVLIVVAS